MVVLRGTKGESMKVLIKIEVGSTGQDKFADVDFDTQLDARARRRWRSARGFWAGISLTL